MVRRYKENVDRTGGHERDVWQPSGRAARTSGLREIADVVVDTASLSVEGQQRFARLVRIARERLSVADIFASSKGRPGRGHVRTSAPTKPHTTELRPSPAGRASPQRRFGQRHQSSRPSPRHLAFLIPRYAARARRTSPLYRLHGGGTAQCESGRPRRYLKEEGADSTPRTLGPTPHLESSAGRKSGHGMAL